MRKTTPQAHRPSPQLRAFPTTVRWARPRCQADFSQVIQSTYTKGGAIDTAQSLGFGNPGCRRRARHSVL